MKRSKFTEKQILAILKLTELGMKMTDICREHGINNAIIISGKASTVAWKRRIYNGCETLR